MYASQWFLTLFTARFPLFFVFRIMDVVLLQGLDTLFQVAIALLQVHYNKFVMLRVKKLNNIFSSFAKKIYYRWILKIFSNILELRCQKKYVTKKLLDI